MIAIQILPDHAAAAKGVGKQPCTPSRAPGSVAVVMNQLIPDPVKRQRAWPVDFSGYDTSEAIIDRLEVLRPLVWRGHEDICWVSWEIERLTAMLFEET